MANQEKIYEVLGELLYAVAMADGVIQPEEKDALQSLLVDHPWASDIRWSFQYEAKHDATVKELYDKAITFCKMEGPHPAYAEFVEAMKTIAEAADGMDKREKELIQSFSKDLIDQFQNDVDHPE